jgi:hypothetical protein
MSMRDIIHLTDIRLLYQYHIKVMFVEQVFYSIAITAIQNPCLDDKFIESFEHASLLVSKTSCVRA